MTNLFFFPLSPPRLGGQPPPSFKQKSIIKSEIYFLNDGPAAKKTPQISTVGVLFLRAPLYFSELQ
jgi:hypothetical protein